jgi:hypothetical protein
VCIIDTTSGISKKYWLLCLILDSRNELSLIAEFPASSTLLNDVVRSCPYTLSDVQELMGFIVMDEGLFSRGNRCLHFYWKRVGSSRLICLHNSIASRKRRFQVAILVS